MSTTHLSTAQASERWLVYDATGEPLGRLASRIAMNLMGKDIPQYTPNALHGAFVIVTHAEKIHISGNKSEQKYYAHYSGYPGGRKEVPYADLAARRPEEIIRLAVKRMLPKNNLGMDMLRRLKVYAGADHPHAAQMPVLTARNTQAARKKS